MREIKQIANGILVFFVRTLGFVLLLAGLWVILQVLSAAQNLYQHPDNITRFAIAIQKGSNVDNAFQFLDKEPAYPTQQKNDKVSDAAANNSLKLSYFFAWVVVMLLFLLITRIALSCVRAGSELILFDLQIKRLARALAKELNK